jgi:hypothetical protein
MSTNPTADDLQRQMQQVRVEMREDVQVMVDNAREMTDMAREMTDWTWYVRRYPWVCLGAAAAVGYLVVPSRSQPAIKPDAKDLLELAKHQKIVVKMEEPKSARPGIVGTLARMAASSLLQGGMAVVSQQLDQFLKQPREPRPVSSNGNGRGPVHD